MVPGAAALAAWWLNYLNIGVAEFFEHFSPSLAEIFERRHTDGYDQKISVPKL